MRHLGVQSNEFEFILGSQIFGPTNELKFYSFDISRIVDVAEKIMALFRIPSVEIYTDSIRLANYELAYPRQVKRFILASHGSHGYDWYRIERE